MSLGDRCDEIVRLIDETFADLGIEVVGDDGHGATVTELPGPDAGEPGRAPHVLAKPRRAVSSF